MSQTMDRQTNAAKYLLDKIQNDAVTRHNLAVILIAAAQAKKRQGN